LHIADAMQDAWLSFARTGRPSGEWPEYDTNRRATMEFGETIQVVDDPGRDLRVAWYGEG
jgi:carboxylesterase type B